MKAKGNKRQRAKGEGLKAEARTQNREQETKNKNGKSVFCCFSFFVFSFLFLTFSLLPLAICPLSFAGDEVARIQKAYENIKDIKGNFVQKSYIKDLKRTDTYSGQFFIKPPKIKWEFRGDRPQAIYMNGEELLIYQKKEKQVFKTKFDKAAYGQIPIALLGGFGDINKEFDASMKAGKLILKPRKRMGTIVRIELTLADAVFPIEALTVLDTASNRIDITLKDVKINTGLDERTFEFTPPEGVAVIQQ